MAGRKGQEFTAETKRQLAQRAGYRCSHPECRRPTSGPQMGGDGVVSIGEAAHITAAAPGPGAARYDATLSSEERRGFNNGIWMCGVHAKLIDNDEKQYTVALLRNWKAKAEDAAFQEITTGRLSLPVPAPEQLDPEVLAKLGIRDPDLEALTQRARVAAEEDIATFKTDERWPAHPISLSLKSADAGGHRFDFVTCARALQSCGQMAIISQPGTGKSITSVQVVDALLQRPEQVAIRVPLNEWSAFPEGILDSLTRRVSFRTFQQSQFIFLALHGRLTLVLDGWNELDAASRKRARADLSQLFRGCPLLEIVITSRRQAMDLPVAGRVVEIQPLSERQQIEIARAVHGDRGEAMIDRAWRIPGLRKLVSIPLYLNALLLSSPDGKLPTTKEAALRLFVRQHDERPENEEALRAVLHGMHHDILTALAIEATHSGNTWLADDRARPVVAAAGRRLKDSGQLEAAPQPGDVLDVLVNHHTLIRAGRDGGVSFQHQQIQEWFAARYVEALMLSSAAGNPEARNELRTKVLNWGKWDESLHFACERLSHLDNRGIDAVAACVLEGLAIDPLLTAGMIYRSAPAVWDQVAHEVVAFVSRWHRPTEADLAFRFMMISGRGEFSNEVWAVVHRAHEDQGRVFDRRPIRPGALGPNAADTIERLVVQMRRDVIWNLAYNGDMDAMELAAGLAARDVQPSTQVDIIQILQMRGSDRLVREILAAASPEVWRSLAVDDFADEVDDADIRQKLSEIVRNVAGNEKDPLRRIRYLLRRDDPKAEVGGQIAAIIASEEFEVKSGGLGGSVSEAFSKYPEEVGKAMLQRLERGLEIPGDGEEGLYGCPVIDEEPIAGVVLRGAARIAESAVALAGPCIVGALIDERLAQGGRVESEAALERQRLVEALIKRSRVGSFVPAWLERAGTNDPDQISVLSGLLQCHGRERVDDLPLQIEQMDHARLVAAYVRWADVLLASPVANRQHLAEWTRGTRRLRSEALLELLARFLAEDLARWRNAQAQRVRAQQQSPEAYMNWCRYYTDAFVAIGSENACNVLIGYLRDDLFGPDAARALKRIYDAAQPTPEERGYVFGLDFAQFREMRMSRGAERVVTPLTAEAILAVVRDYIRPEATEAERKRALDLAAIALRFPVADRGIVEALLAQPVSIRLKREVLVAQLLAGETIPANLVMEGVIEWEREQRAAKWADPQVNWRLEEWLDLLPFSDRPSALLEALDRTVDIRWPIPRMTHLFTSLQNAPGEEVEEVIIELGRRDPALFGHQWRSALMNRQTTSAYIRLFSVLLDPNVPDKAKKELESWHVREDLARHLKQHPEFRSELLKRYSDPAMLVIRPIVERALTAVPDIETVAQLVGAKAAGGGYDKALRSAIRNMALMDQHMPGHSGMIETVPIDASELRKRLLTIALSDGGEAELAKWCLIAIDRIRYSLGRPETEPRHPDIDSAVPWPLTNNL